MGVSHAREPTVGTPSIEHYFARQVYTVNRSYVRFCTKDSIKPSTDPTLVDTSHSSKVCRDCGCDRLMTTYSGIVCQNCGELSSNVVMVTSASSQSFGGSFASSSSSSSGKRITTYMYKRTNHFLDHLKRVQAKESLSVRPEVLQCVRNELAKERIFDCDARITTAKVRGILKKLKLQKYYNHVFSITSFLSGRRPPSLTPIQEEKLLSMFQVIQQPFSRHCPPDRTNMISYSYVLRKLVEILGWYDLIDYFPLLKSRTKVFSQDVLWKKICQDVGFPFYRSIA